MRGQSLTVVNNQKGGIIFLESNRERGCGFLLVEVVPCGGSHFLLISWCSKIAYSKLADIYIRHVQIK